MNNKRFSTHTKFLWYVAKFKSFLFRMRMNCYKIKIYCFRKAVIMLTPIPTHSQGCRLVRATSIASCLCFWAHSVLSQWQLVLSPPLCIPPYSSQSRADPNPSIHIYAKQKAKVLCHFLVVDSCFSHNFISSRPSSALGICPKENLFSRYPPFHPL